MNMRDNNNTIQSLCEKLGNEDLNKLYDSMKENITTFRKAHKSVIENIIPDVLV
jgi:hypothetical protein